MSGKIHKNVKQVETGLSYSWYVGGYFTTPERLFDYWDRYGRPVELVNDRVNYSPQLWESFVDAVSEYFFPIPTIPIAPHEALFEGITIARVQYYMRKKPQFVHEVMGEYAKANVEVIKRFGEAGVDIAWMYDDLGYKGSSIFSPKAFREFILPYYKQIYQACKKNGMLIVQHSCGYIDKLLPDMVDAGLNGIQALEPAAGVDLAGIKETLGERLCLIGGMDSSRVLNFGTPKDIEEDVKKCIKAAAPGGGYFAGPSHNILNAPWENVLALRAAIEKHRKYPLNV
jgi:uroporphyrinogen-III decarboxylase